MHYGKRLKELMQQRGVSQEKLAQRLKVRQQNISNWFKSQEPPLSKIELVCHALGVNVYELWITKEEHIAKMVLPEHIRDHALFIKNQSPEFQEFIMQITYRAAELVDKPKSA